MVNVIARPLSGEKVAEFSLQTLLAVHEEIELLLKCYKQSISACDEVFSKQEQLFGTWP